MKKIFLNFIIIIILSIISLITVISIFGIETTKFNNIISQKIKDTNNNLEVKLNTIKFKLDIKQVSLFLETKNPIISYREVLIPAQNIKVYIDFFSLVKSKTKIDKINIVLNQIDITQLKKISTTFKPSNYKSFIDHKINQGKMNVEIEIYLENNNLLDNFIARGSVSGLSAELLNGVFIEKTNFTFIADKTDILIKKIFSNSDFLNIIDGDLKLKLEPEISLVSNFKAKLNFNGNQSNFKDLIKNYNFSNDLNTLEAELNNTLFIKFDNTYKVKNYNFKSNGKVNNVVFNFKKSFESQLFEKKIEDLFLKNSEIKLNLNPQKKIVNLSGDYSFNDQNFLKFSLENIFTKKNKKLNMNFDLNKIIELNIINYKKPKDTIANVSFSANKQKDLYLINKLTFDDKKSFISIQDLKLKKNKIIGFDQILIKTFNNKNKNNDFTIKYGGNLSIKGSHFDATNLPKFLNEESKGNMLSNLSKNIEIDFENVKVPLSDKLKNFKLIGKINKGEFTKISSKGDFGGEKYLDIKMKSDQSKNKKYLEIYSDLTKPLLTEYNFFKGLTGGKLLFTSVVDKNSSNSKLIIENFKVVNAPGLIKLLSLADLGGLADLAKGEGLSFDILEIKMVKTKDLLNINEILALGPSISVLMEGYQNPTTTSLRGTLVPAKSLNKMISKIPVIGDIVIPKEVGEGLFGISFKMKGPNGNIKTSINPIRTITPRFIQKIIDKNKKTK